MLCWFQKILIPERSQISQNSFGRLSNPNFTRQFEQTAAKKRRNKQGPCQRVINYGTVWRKDPANWGLESEEDGDSPSNQQTILLLLNQVRKMVTLPATSRLFYCCWTKWGRQWLSQQPTDYSTAAEPARKMVTLPATSRLFYCCWTKWGRWWLSQQPTDYSTAVELVVLTAKDKVFQHGVVDALCGVNFVMAEAGHLKERHFFHLRAGQEILISLQRQHVC